MAIIVISRGKPQSSTTKKLNMKTIQCNDIQWKTTSQYNDPHFSTFYTTPIEIPIKTPFEGFTDKLEFFIKDNGYHLLSEHCVDYRLILKVETHQHSKKTQVIFFDLGNFVDDRDALFNVQSYAKYVLGGYQLSTDLRHCPSFEIIDDVDENFNPLFPTANPC